MTEDITRCMHHQSTGSQASAMQDDGSAEVVFETKASLYIQSSEAAGKVKGLIASIGKIWYTQGKKVAQNPFSCTAYLCNQKNERTA